MDDSPAPSFGSHLRQISEAKERNSSSNLRQKLSARSLGHRKTTDAPSLRPSPLGAHKATNNDFKEKNTQTPKQTRGKKNRRPLTNQKLEKKVRKQTPRKHTPNSSFSKQQLLLSLSALKGFVLPGAAQRHFHRPLLLLRRRPADLASKATNCCPAGFPQSEKVKLKFICFLFKLENQQAKVQDG